MTSIKYYDIDTGALAGEITDNDGHLENPEIYRETDPTGQTLPIDTLTFALNMKTGMPDLAEGQCVELWRNGEIQARMYVNKVDKINSFTAEISCYSIFGKIESEVFNGGMYTNYSVRTLVADILNGYPYDISGIPASATVTGWMPCASKRAAMQQLYLSAGLITVHEKCDKTYIKQYVSNYSGETLLVIPRQSITETPELKDSSYVGTSYVTATDVTLEKTEEEEMLWMGVIDNATTDTGVTGQHIIRFAKPHHSYRMVYGGPSGSKIVSYDVNHVVVYLPESVANYTVTVYGKKYAESTVSGYDTNYNTEYEGCVYKDSTKTIDVGKLYLYGDTRYMVIARCKDVIADKINLSVSIVQRDSAIRPIPNRWVRCTVGGTMYEGRVRKMTAAYGYNNITYDIEADVHKW